LFLGKFPVEVVVVRTLKNRWGNRCDDHHRRFMRRRLFGHSDIDIDDLPHREWFVGQSAGEHTGQRWQAIK